MLLFKLHSNTNDNYTNLKKNEENEKILFVNDYYSVCMIGHHSIAM